MTTRGSGSTRPPPSSSRSATPSRTCWGRPRRPRGPTEEGNFHAVTNLSAAKVLVTDFDGTMTRRDFYKLAIERLLPPDTPDFWAEYRAGAITHFEALRRYFASIRSSEDEVLAVVACME